MSRKWYIAQTHSGSENSVKADIERRVESMNMQDIIYQVLVAEEEYEDVLKSGKKVIKTKKMFPGYIFIEMEVEDSKDMDEEAWFMVRNTQKVTGFLGSSGGGIKPTPVPIEDINAILLKLGKIEKAAFEFAVGEQVIITTGPWKNQLVEISAVNEEKEILTVLVEMFGRRTPAEVSTNEVRKKN